MYTCRDGWPTCRCIQGLRTFVWTVLPPDSQRRFDWIDSIHLFPTASSLSLARTLGSPPRRRLRPAAVATTTTEGGGVDLDYCCSFPAPSTEWSRLGAKICGAETCYLGDRTRGVDPQGPKMSLSLSGDQMLILLKKSQIVKN